MEIPYKNLDKQTLNGLIKDIVTRDGTDYGFEEVSVERKIASVMTSLDKGSAYLYWDMDSETVSLHSAEDKPNTDF